MRVPFEINQRKEIESIRSKSKNIPNLLKFSFPGRALFPVLVFLIGTVTPLFSQEFVSQKFVTKKIEPAYAWALTEMKLNLNDKEAFDLAKVFFLNPKGDLSSDRIPETKITRAGKRNQPETTWFCDKELSGYYQFADSGHKYYTKLLFSGFYQYKQYIIIATADEKLKETDNWKVHLLTFTTGGIGQLYEIPGSYEIDPDKPEAILPFIGERGELRLTARNLDQGYASRYDNYRFLVASEYFLFLIDDIRLNEDNHQQHPQGSDHYTPGYKGRYEFYYDKKKDNSVFSVIPALMIEFSGSIYDDYLGENLNYNFTSFYKLNPDKEKFEKEVH